MKNYRLGLYEKSMPKSLDWGDKLRIAKSAGYDYVEISIDETDEKLKRLDMTASELDSLNKKIKGAGTGIASMCLSGHRKYPLGSSDPQIRGRGLEIMEKAVDFAARLNIRIIQLAGYDAYYEPSTPETVKWFSQNLLRAVDMAAKEGVVLGFETMETPFMDTVEKAMKYVSAVNSPWLQVYPDCGNLTNASKLYGVSVTDDLEKGRGHIAALHLKETLPGVYREVPFGEGHVDFDGAISKALTLGVRMFVTELWYTGNGDWKDVISATGMEMGNRLAKADAEYMRIRKDADVKH